MKNVLLATIFALAGVAGSISVAKADQACEPAGAAQMRAEMASEQNGSTAIRLGGDQAERFFYYLNDKVGRHTDYWGDGVIIGRYPMLGYDAVAIVDDGCVDESKLIRLDPGTTEQAVLASQNPFE